MSSSVAVNTDAIRNLGTQFGSGATQLSESGNSLVTNSATTGAPFGRTSDSGAAMDSYTNTHAQLADLINKLGSSLQYHRNTLMTAAGTYDQGEQDNADLARSLLV